MDGFLHTGFYSLVLTVCMHDIIAGDAQADVFNSRCGPSGTEPVV